MRQFSNHYLFKSESVIVGTIDQEIAAFINDGQTKDEARELYESLNNINDYENCKWGYTFLNASSIYDNVAFNFSG